MAHMLRMLCENQLVWYNLSALKDCWCLKPVGVAVETDRNLQLEKSAVDIKLKSEPVIRHLVCKQTVIATVSTDHWAGSCCTENGESCIYFAEKLHEMFLSVQLRKQEIKSLKKLAVSIRTRKFCRIISVSVFFNEFWPNFLCGLFARVGTMGQKFWPCCQTCRKL